MDEDVNAKLEGGVFECPQAHLDKLAALLPAVTKLLLIGWRATEAHFLEFLHTHLKAGIHLYTVAGKEMDAMNVNKALLASLPAIFASATADPEMNGTGFTNFLLSGRAKSFLDK